MSCTMHNRNLARLCQAHDLRLGDLEIILKCSQKNIYLYAAGRKPMPILERKLAALFKLSVPDLRKFIFSKRRLNDPAFSAYLQTVHVVYRLLWRWDRSTGKEQWFNHGEVLANDARFMGCREDGMRQPRIAIIKGRFIGEGVKFQLLSAKRPLTKEERRAS